MPERTVEQVLVTTSIDGRLSKTEPNNWRKKVRQMRNDPTIGLLRDLYGAAIRGMSWTIVSDDEEFKDAEDMISESVVAHQSTILMSAVRGLLDFGWQAFETVTSLRHDGEVMITKFKPLLQDITEILVNVRGHLIGVRNQPTMGVMTNGLWVDLNRNECCVVWRDAEGTNWYGAPLMRRVEVAYDAWKDCDEAASRYDTKLAGAHWIIGYPTGTTDINGVEKDNFDIVEQDIIPRLKSSGIIVIPRKPLDYTDPIELSKSGLSDDKMAWSIKMESAQGSESGFVDRQKYLDTLKARGFGFPERAVLEGQFGTKAEAEAHADFAIDALEVAHNDTVDLINAQTVDGLLRVNRGPRYVGKVRIVAAPLSDVKRARLRNLYMTILQSDPEELKHLDVPAIREELEYPTRDDESTMDNMEDANGTNEVRSQPQRA